MDDPRGMYYPRAVEEMAEGSPKWVMARNLTHKLVYRPRGVSELYDLASDPRELDNLWGKPSAAPLQGAMERELLGWLVETADVTPIRMDPRRTPKWDPSGRG